MKTTITLEDKYTATEGRVLISGLQALVRLPLVQMRRDHAQGLNTAAFISGYRGSPLGAFDLYCHQARALFEQHDIVFQPGLNEDLAATMVWGSQQVALSRGVRKQGVVGLWYGKGPGVDRCGDVFKHANAAGSAALGGVLAIAGDDHTAKSSSIPHQSDHAFISALMPVLYPSSIHEFIELGLLGIAMSRYSGCWVGFKVISETVETTSVIELAAEQREFVLPADFVMPDGGLNLRWPDPPLEQDERLQEFKGDAAVAFARANQVDQLVIDSREARFGIIASGRAYEDVIQALEELGLERSQCQQLGLRLYKVRMPWPLEPVGVRRFASGLEEILIIEERREMIENQIKQQLFNVSSTIRPRIIGKLDERDRPFLPHSTGLTIGRVARAVANRLLRLEMPAELRQLIETRLHRLEQQQRQHDRHVPSIVRKPHYCAGCPHNLSTRVPAGSTAMAGIGCHYMVQWMDRNTDTFTHMGAEGVPWAAISHFTDEAHRFVNLGDGTYFHSGILAIRQSVAAKATITYKLLYNDAVAMTGGQPLDGELSPQQLVWQLFHEKVGKIYLLSDNPASYDPSRLPPGTRVRHRNDIDEVMLTLRELEGVTAMVYVQTCAAELRRRRKRGLVADPDMRLFIHPEVCEGCGDCQQQSNCIAIEPLETEFGRKREINQSSCNKDYSCIKGFCPSFVILRDARPKQQHPASMPDFSALPRVEIPAPHAIWNIAVTGVGGTGVLTIGAILAMAAHLEQKNPLVMDMAGLAQKGGAVLSHIRIGNAFSQVREPHIAAGEADLLLAADAVVAVSDSAIKLCDPDRTHAVINLHNSPVSDFIGAPDFDFRPQHVHQQLACRVRPFSHSHAFADIATALCGDAIATNVMMLGFAWQQGLIPLGIEAICEAIELNGVAVENNLTALNWGRLLAHDPNQVLSHLPEQPHPISLAAMPLDELIAHRSRHLRQYQNIALAQRYEKRIAQLQQAAMGLSQSAQLVRSAAVNYARVLAYKDEYEVARLYTRPEFQQQLQHHFEGNFRLSYFFAPPFFGGKTASGRPAQREFSGRVLWVLKSLARLRWLRGTPLDLFGYRQERRQERQLIRHYENDLGNACKTLTEDTSEFWLKLLRLPDTVRGFGPVKQQAMAQYQQQRQILLSDLRKHFALHHRQGDPDSGMSFH